MSDRLETGVAHLASRLKSHASRPVTYRRGALSATVSATLDSQLLRTTDRLGNTKVERTDRDFLITAADLVLAGQVVTPQRGDQVDVTFGSVTERFEVVAVGTEPHWRYEDNHQMVLRVHTKSIGTV